MATICSGSLSGSLSFARTGIKTCVEAAVEAVSGAATGALFARATVTTTRPWAHRLALDSVGELVLSQEAHGRGIGEALVGVQRHLAAGGLAEAGQNPAGLDRREGVMLAGLSGATVTLTSGIAFGKEVLRGE